MTASLLPLSSVLITSTLTYPLSQLLRTSHGLPLESKLVSVARSFDGTIVDWTLGSLLHEVVHRPPPTNSRALASTHHDYSHI